MDFVVGGLAAGMACIFSNPFDVLKTRMQLQGELRARGEHAVHYRNVFHAGFTVAQNEGLRGLQRGLGTAVILHGVRNSIRLGSYQWLERRGFLSGKSGKQAVWRCTVASAATGAMGAFIGSPLFLVKTQLQSQAAESIAVGHQHGHKGPIDAVVGIYRSHGVIGLWRGCSGTVVRALAGSSAQLGTFAASKEYLKQYQTLKENPTLAAFVASTLAGLCQTVVIQPFDLVSTRLYNQPLNSQGKGTLYRGIIDCFWKTGKKEGLRGFYKGVTANYMRLGPHSTLTLIFWELLKDAQKRHESRTLIS